MFDMGGGGFSATMFHMFLFLKTTLEPVDKISKKRIQYCLKGILTTKNRCFKLKIIVFGS